MKEIIYTNKKDLKSNLCEALNNTPSAGTVTIRELDILCESVLRLKIDCYLIYNHKQNFSFVRPYPLATVKEETILKIGKLEK